MFIQPELHASRKNVVIGKFLNKKSKLIFTVTLFRFPDAVNSEFPMGTNRSDREKFLQKKSQLK